MKVSQILYKRIPPANIIVPYPSEDTTLPHKIVPDSTFRDGIVPDPLLACMDRYGHKTCSEYHNHVADCSLPLYCPSITIQLSHMEMKVLQIFYKAAETDREI